MPTPKPETLWQCRECGARNPARETRCEECGGERTPPAAAPRPAYGPPPGQERRTHLRCPVHHVVLDGSGYCSVGQSWWYPKFACPACAGPLEDNGACPNCTPKLGQFTGDGFEQRWDPIAGREYAHYVRVSTGPTPMPSAGEVAGFLTELHAKLKGLPA